MGLDFIYKTNNRFTTAERRNYAEQLGQKTLFSLAPHIFKRQFTCEQPHGSSTKTIAGQVFLLRINDGFCVISPENPTEVLGFVCEDATKELDEAFNKLPEAPHALIGTVTAVGECTPTFTVEIDSPDQIDDDPENEQ